LFVDHAGRRGADHARDFCPAPPPTARLQGEYPAEDGVTPRLRDCVQAGWTRGLAVCSCARMFCQVVSGVLARTTDRRFASVEVA